MPQGVFAWQEKGHREAHPARGAGDRQPPQRARGSACLGGGLGKAGSVRMPPGAGKGNEPGERGRPREAGGKPGAVRPLAQGLEKESPPGGRGKREDPTIACGVPNPGGKELPVDHGGQGKRGSRVCSRYQRGRLRPVPQKGKGKRPGKHLPGLSFVSRRRSRALARFCITSMSPSLSRGDGRKSHTR